MDVHPHKHIIAPFWLSSKLRISQADHRIRLKYVNVVYILFLVPGSFPIDGFLLCDVFRLVQAADLDSSGDEMPLVQGRERAPDSSDEEL